ncbi:MAG: TadE/TadG family type IV pilus assembly protein [Phycisphaerae bacterium]
MARRKLFRVHRSRSRERGGAIVEFAVVLPLLLTVLFGIIEYGWVFSVRQTLQHAAREGCRLAVLQTSVEPYANVSNRVAEVMSAARIAGYTLNMEHAIEGVSDTEVITVSVDYASISLVGGFFGTANYTLAGTCSMRKEGISDS